MEVKFKILGSDGLEYPDLSESLLKLWHEQHRVEAATKVCAEGTDQWSTLGEMFPWARNQAPRIELDATPAVSPKVACLNHPARESVASCTVCAEPFCPECLAVQGVSAVCRSCHASAPAPFRNMEPQETEATALASESLKYALVSIICCGIILAPIGLYKAIEAKKMEAQSDCPVRGMGKATAAIWVASIVLGLNIIGLLARVLGETANIK